MGKKLTTEEWIRRANEKHNGKYDYSLVKYVNSRTEVKIICPIHGEFSQIADTHLRSNGCYLCGLDFSKKKRTGMGTSNTEEFIKKATVIHDSKYDYSLVDYKNNTILVKIICPEHGTFEQQPNNHLQGKGCRDCAIAKMVERQRYSTEEWIEKAIKVHGSLYDYSETKYVDSYTKVRVRCKKHNHFFEQTPKDHLKSCGCKSCRQSLGEKRVAEELERLSIIYTPQNKFPKCRNKRALPFDFYLPDYNLCIEYQGQQHYHIREFFGGLKNLQYTQNNDQIKRDFCKENNIKLLEIPYWDFDNIEQILDKTIRRE